MVPLLKPDTHVASGSRVLNSTLGVRPGIKSKTCPGRKFSHLHTSDPGATIKKSRMGSETSLSFPLWICFQCKSAHLSRRGEFGIVRGGGLTSSPICGSEMASVLEDLPTRQALALPPLETARQIPECCQLVGSKTVP
jgi:hypothetical protein